MTEVNLCASEKTQENTKYTEVKDPYGFVYITTNLYNGKRYLGQKRFINGWENYLGSGSAFKRALKKYGKENFKRDIVCICFSEQELNKVEYELSVFLNVVESDDWYNLAFGGGTTSGWHPSEETRKKIGNKTRERLSDSSNHPRYGKPGLIGEKNPQFGISPKERMDKETYNCWYEKHKVYWSNPATKGAHIWSGKVHPKTGTHLSQEQKDNLSTKAKERYKNQENHPMYGKKMSDSSKQKMSQFRQSKDWWACKKIYCVELDEIFFSAQNASSIYGFDQSCILKCCKGNRKFAYRHPETNEQLHWLYVEDAIKKEYITQQDLNNYLVKLTSKGE